jgi:hypothetical protein
MPAASSALSTSTKSIIRSNWTGPEDMHFSIIWRLIGTWLLTSLIVTHSL